MQLLEAKEERRTRQREDANQRAIVLEELQLQKGLPPEVGLVQQRNCLRVNISKARYKMKAFPGHTLYTQWSKKLNHWQEQLREIEIKLNRQYTQSLQIPSTQAL